MTKLSPHELHTLADRLAHRRRDLAAMIQAGAADAGHDNLQRAGGDPGDKSAEVQQAELDLTEMENEARELRAIDQAQERVKNGTYGYCVECGHPIPYARLEAYPAAERCTECQTRHEGVRGGRDATPSL